MRSAFTVCGLLAVIGLFCILCSVGNYDWFFENRRAKPFVRMFGRKGARILYFAFGIFLVGLVAMMMLNALL